MFESEREQQDVSRTTTPQATEKTPAQLPLDHVGRFVILVLSFLRPVPDLQICLEYWQRELKLEDWAIEMRVVAQRDLEHGTLGDVEPILKTRTAVIRVMVEHESDLSGRLAKADQRFTIVHEMVHLRRFANGDPKWGSEGTTNTEANKLIRKNHRWLEWLVVED